MKKFLSSRLQKKRILTIGLGLVLTLGINTATFASEPAMHLGGIGLAADVDVEETSIVTFEEVTLLTSSELLALIESAPAHQDTRSAVPLSDRRITSSELEDWIEEYLALGINAFELEMVRLINIERENHNLNPLAINPNLMMAARFHSQEMVDLRFFNHRSPHHGRGIYRAEMFGHENIQDHVWGVRENIASGVRTPEQIVQAWMNSPSHRSAILGDTYLTIGVGTVQNSTTAKFGS